MRTSNGVGSAHARCESSSDACLCWHRPKTGICVVCCVCVCGHLSKNVILSPPPSFFLFLCIFFRCMIFFCETTFGEVPAMPKSIVLFTCGCFDLYKSKKKCAPKKAVGVPWPSRATAKPKGRVIHQTQETEVLCSPTLHPAELKAQTLLGRE